MGDVDRADDLVQECLTRAIAKIDSWQPGTNLHAWLFVIMRNCFFNDLRRKSRSPIIEDAKATGRGAFHVLETLRGELDLPDKPPVAIQGFGNAARHLAELLVTGDYKVIAVSDSNGATMNEDGLDIKLLGDHKEDQGGVADFANDLDADDLLTIECDLLVSAALGGVVSEEHAGDVNANAFLEVANGPITASAEDILTENKVQVVPDILANGGGVTVSYLEWVQNRSENYWPLDTVRDRLERRMMDETNAVLELASKKSLTLRQAAYVHASERLCRTIDATGTEAFYKGD